MINNLSFDIEDWFQVENLKCAVKSAQWDTYESRIERNTEKILEILAARDTKATFFVLGWIAKKYPVLVKRIDSLGHEIASHGFWHRLIYSQTREEFKYDLELSKKTLEDIVQKEVIGYRAPSFSITKDSLWALDVIKECGFVYDSSIFPTSFHNRYGFEGMGNKITSFENGLIEVPISVFPFLNLKFPLGGGGYFRLYPYWYFRLFSGILNRQGTSFTFYMHPWELDNEQPRMKVPMVLGFRHYVNLKNTETRLKKLVKDFSFQPIRKVIN